MVIKSIWGKLYNGLYRCEWGPVWSMWLQEQLIPRRKRFHLCCIAESTTLSWAYLWWRNGEDMMQFIEFHFVGQLKKSISFLRKCQDITAKRMKDDAGSKGLMWGWRTVHNSDWSNWSEKKAFPPVCQDCQQPSDVIQFSFRRIASSFRCIKSFPVTLKMWYWILALGTSFGISAVEAKKGGRAQLLINSPCSCFYDIK